jgi:hypothetical protein
MALNFRKFIEGLRIVPKAASTASEKGDLDVVSGSGKLNYHNGTTASPIVTEAHSATLTNKTIDGDDNTIQDVGIASLKTVLGDANKVIRRDAAGVVTSGNSLPNSSQIVTLDSSDTLTNKTIDGDTNTVQNLALSSLKTVLSDANKTVRRDASGVVTSGNALPNSSQIITLDSSDTLTNKTIDGDTNTVQDLALSTLKTVLGDANKVVRRDASGIVVSGNALPNSSQIVTLDSSATLTNKTIDGDDNTIQDIGIASIKTVLADANKVIRRDASGVVTSGNSLPNSSQIVTLDSSGTLTNKTLTSPVLNTPTADTITGIVGGALTIQSASNQNLILQGQGTGYVRAVTRLSIDGKLDTPSEADTTSGSGVTLATPSKTVVRLTNASLVSVNMIPAGVDGQQLTLVNTTSVGITFNDETGATAANRIRTGTGAPVTIQNNASIELVYNGTTSRWMIVGGVGGSNSDVVSTSVDLTLTNTNEVVLASAASGLRTITLPSPSNGKKFTIKKTDSAVNVVKVLPVGGATIDGVASYNISAQYQSITIVTDGTNWYII